uniref:Uncharacterized protein n=1 Tax=Octopus bimaculoides TaxID=37653 RepID=A0A0L8I522_OCTBM
MCPHVKLSSGNIAWESNHTTVSLITTAEVRDCLLFASGNIIDRMNQLNDVYTQISFYWLFLTVL